MGSERGVAGRPFVPVASWLCLVVTAACVAVMLTLRALGLGSHSRRLLIAASTAFVLLPIVGGALRTLHGKLLTLGLVCCWIGDYTGPTAFTASLLCFLLAHVWFVAVFAARAGDVRRVLVIGPLLCVSCVFITRWLTPHVPDSLIAPVDAYILVISAMVLFAGGVRPGPGRDIALLGAILFYVSDIFVARWRFVDASSANAYGCYPLYYTACLLLGLSGVVEARAGGSAALEEGTDEAE